jgi:hypothetical protein
MVISLAFYPIALRSLGFQRVGAEPHKTIAHVAPGADQAVSLADPLQIAMLKGLIAGPFNLILGLSISHEIPNVSGTRPP